MKGYVLHGIDKLKYEDISMPDLKPGWALVEVKASGICSSDIPRIFKKGTYHFPTIPGHEFSGIVKAVGSSEDKNFINKRVGVFPLIPCQKCSECKNSHYEMCENYDYLGSRRDGGFAEYVNVPVWNLLPIPDNVSYIEAAMIEPFAVALHAVNQADITPEDRVAVIGTGMIGFAAAQWAKVKGAKEVYIVGRNDKKNFIADKLGNITYTVCTNLKTDLNVDKVIEAVGSESAIETAIATVTSGGTIVLMGNPNGDITLKQNTYWRILRKQLRIIGTWNSSYESMKNCEWTEVVSALAEKKIRADFLISHQYKQEDLITALNMMCETTTTYMKVMVTWNEQ